MGVDVYRAMLETVCEHLNGVGMGAHVVRVSRIASTMHKNRNNEWVVRVNVVSRHGSPSEFEVSVKDDELVTCHVGWPCKASKMVFAMSDPGCYDQLAGFLREY